MEREKYREYVNDRAAKKMQQVSEEYTVRFFGLEVYESRHVHG
jgi:hypothetical protein